MAKKRVAKIRPKRSLVLELENQALKYLLTIEILTNVRCDSQLPCESAGSKSCHDSRRLRLDQVKAH